MIAAKTVGAQPKKRRKKHAGTEVSIEKDLRSMIVKKYARERRKQMNAADRQALGVLPKALKRYANKIRGSRAAADFLTRLPHTWVEEDLLHAYLINGCRDAGTCLALTEAFLPYVDNDDVFYALQPKALLTDEGVLRDKAPEWIAGDAPYAAALGIRLLARAVTEKKPPEEDCLPLIDQCPCSSHPTVTLCAADYCFRLLKYGDDTVRAGICALAEQKNPAAVRGVYAYQKDCAATGKAPSEQTEEVPVPVPAD